jgi:hypothetical protein
LEIQTEPLHSSDESKLKGAKSNNHERPFKVNKSYGPYWILPGEGECGDYPLAQVLIEGEANATHLGKFTVINIYCMNFDFGYPISAIEGTMTAANGDELHTNIPTPWDGVSIYPGENGVTFYVYTIMGGNGRFENATGTILMWGTTTEDPNNPLAGTWEMEGEGTISY